LLAPLALNICPEALNYQNNFLAVSLLWTVAIKENKWCVSGFEGTTHGSFLVETDRKHQGGVAINQSLALLLANYDFRKSLLSGTVT